MANVENNLCKDASVQPQKNSRRRIGWRKWEHEQAKEERADPTKGGWIQRNYRSTIPRFSARVTAWVRSLAPSLDKIFVT